MKYIITESQMNSLLSSLLDDLFSGYETKFENEDRVVYVDGKLMMMIGPNKAVVDNSVVDEVKQVLFYDTLKDFKSEVKHWIISRFGVKPGSEPFYGITFKNLNKN